VRFGGWDEERADAELAAFRDRMRIFHPRNAEALAIS
jgi:hypothetical protein